MIIIYILAVVSFAFLSEILDLHPDIICQSFIPCFVSVLRFGLIENFLVCKLSYIPLAIATVVIRECPS